MPTKYPEEFKREVVAVARTSGLSQGHVARDFGISTHSVQRWVKQADIDDGLTQPTSSTASPATREELRVAIVTWIERIYHRRRRQRALGKLTPIEYKAVIGYNRLADAA